MTVWARVRDKGEAEGVGQLKGFWKSDAMPMVSSFWPRTRLPFALNFILPSEDWARVEEEKKDKAG